MNGTLWYCGTANSTAAPPASWYVAAYPHPHGNAAERAEELERRFREAYQRYLDRLAYLSAKETGGAHPQRKEVKPMKAVFNVVVVTKKGQIVLDTKVVAKDRDEALFEADVSSILKAKGLKPGDVTVLCVKLGDVEIEPEPQKVQIVEAAS